ncbi:MAG: YihY/virulence factor BrkB family protein [Melioribacteraceae bacterium]|jgi:membrane protein|nr:YihY/virulence factor BrkB family protein [Melioribacteraceae bacterium]
MLNKFKQIKSTLQFKVFRKVGKVCSLDRFRKILSFLSHYVGGTFRRLDKNHLFLSAAGIAYSIILSVVPLVLIVFSVLGSMIDVVTIEEQVNTAIDGLIPYADAADYMKNFILSRIPEVVKYKSLAGSIGLLGLFFTSTWLFSSMRTILNKIFRVEESKGALIGLLRDFAMVLLVLVFVLLSTYLLPTINFFVSLTEKVDILERFALGEVIHALVPYISVLLMFLMFYMFYSFIPYVRMHYKVPIASALWATILWEAVRWLFNYYVTSYLALNKLYGTFLFFAVVMFWIFYASMVFLVGAEIGQLYRERRDARRGIIWEKD